MSSIYDPSRFHEFYISNLDKLCQQNETAFKKMKKQVTWATYIPFLSPDIDADKMAGVFVAREYPHDFALTLLFHSGFVSYLAYCGFLVIGGHSDEDAKKKKASDGIEFLFPKLHMQRCLLQVKDFHFSKSVVKKSRDYRLSINSDFDAVVQGCLLQHGESWLYPKTRALYKDMFNSNDLRNNVKVVSVELWIETSKIDQEHRKISPPMGDSDGGPAVLEPEGDHPIKHCLSTKLPNHSQIAGEIGLMIGACYVSLTGFRNTYCDGAGTVQLTTLAALLKVCNVVLWDMGMSNEYKLALGGKEVPRGVFLEQFHNLRDKIDCTLQIPEPDKTYETRTICAKSLINLAK